MENFIDNLRVLPNLPSKNMINGLCCKYHIFSEELLGIAKPICTEPQALYFKAFIDNFSKEVLDLLCTNAAPGSATCREMVYPNKTISDERSVSFVPVMIHALQKL